MSRNDQTEDELALLKLDANHPKDSINYEGKEVKFVIGFMHFSLMSLVLQHDETNSKNFKDESQYPNNPV